MENMTVDEFRSEVGSSTSYYSVTQQSSDCESEVPKLYETRATNTEDDEGILELERNIESLREELAVVRQRTRTSQEKHNVEMFEKKALYGSRLKETSEKAEKLRQQEVEVAADAERQKVRRLNLQKRCDAAKEELRKLNSTNDAKNRELSRLKEQLKLLNETIEDRLDEKSRVEARALAGEDALLRQKERIEASVLVQKKNDAERNLEYLESICEKLRDYTASGKLELVKVASSFALCRKQWEGTLEMLTANISSVKAAYGQCLEQLSKGVPFSQLTKVTVPTCPQPIPTPTMPPWLKVAFDFGTPFVAPPVREESSHITAETEDQQQKVSPANNKQKLTLIVRNYLVDATEDEVFEAFNSIRSWLGDTKIKEVGGEQLVKDVAKMIEKNRKATVANQSRMVHDRPQQLHNVNIVTSAGTPTGRPEPSTSDECQVCLTECATDFELCRNCGKKYHRQCLTPWLQNYNATCPNCRNHFILPNDYPSLHK